MTHYNNIAIIKAALLIFLCSRALFCQAESLAATEAADTLMQELYEAGLPIVSIETIDQEEPSYDVAVAPEGCMGQSIRNATKVPGSISVISPDGSIMYDSGQYSSKEAGMTVKVRGNWSASVLEKKPFKVKLQKKADLLCRGDEKFNDKEWVLLPLFNLNAVIGFKVSELIGMPWTPASHLVNLVFNGDYRGIYLLVESVKRNPACRVDVDKDSGYLFELDAYWWNEDVYFKSSFNERTNYTFKYPDDKEITDGQLDYIQKHILEVEYSLSDGTYPDYIDVESFARWMLAHDILADNDGAGSNLFLTKYDSTSVSKVKMGPLWDFDAIMLSDNWAGAHYYAFFKRLFASSNKSFVEKYASIWNEKGNYVFDKLTEFIDTFPASSVGKAFDRSTVLNNRRWKKKRLSTDDSSTLTNAAISYYSEHRLWLNEAINGLVPETSDIYSVTNNSCDNVQGVTDYCHGHGTNITGIDGSIWGNKSGQRIPRGIYFINGKKIIRK